MNSNNYILRLDKIKEKYNLNSDIYVKLEMYSLTNSIKDKVARLIIKKAKLKKGDTALDATSGNYGIALAFYLKRMDVKLILVVPKSISSVKKNKLKDLNSKLIEIDGNMIDCYNYAKRISNKHNIKFLNQFENKYAYIAHIETAKEIMKKFKEEEIEVMVSLGTSATLVGLNKYLTPNYHINIVKVFGGNVEGVYGGIVGKYFDEIDKTNIEEVIVNYSNLQKVKDDILKLEGLNLGLSSVLNICGAIKKNSYLPTLAICNDGGSNYE